MPFLNNLKPIEGLSQPSGGSILGGPSTGGPALIGPPVQQPPPNSIVGIPGVGDLPAITMNNVSEMLSRLPGLKGASFLNPISRPSGLTTGAFFPAGTRDLTSEQFDLAQEVLNALGIGRSNLIEELFQRNLAENPTFALGLLTSNPRFTPRTAPSSGGGIVGGGGGGGKF